MITAVRSRRGMTLAEILVSLALVMIVIVMTVSFVSLMTERTRVNGENETLRQDRALIQSGVEAWLNRMTADGYTITVTESKLEATKGEYTYGLGYANGKLTGELPDGESITAALETVNSVSFAIQEGTNGKTIYFFTVESEGSSYTFCFYPRLGEAVSAQ